MWGLDLTYKVRIRTRPVYGSDFCIQTKNTGYSVKMPPPYIVNDQINNEIMQTWMSIFRSEFVEFSIFLGRDSFVRPDFCSRLLHCFWILFLDTNFLDVSECVMKCTKVFDIIVRRIQNCRYNWEMKPDTAMRYRFGFTFLQFLIAKVILFLKVSGNSMPSF